MPKKGPTKRSTSRDDIAKDEAASDRRPKRSKKALTNLKTSTTATTAAAPTTSSTTYDGSLAGLISKQNSLIERQLRVYQEGSSRMRYALESKYNSDRLVRANILILQTRLETAKFEMHCGNEALARELFMEANQLARELHESALNPTDPQAPLQEVNTERHENESVEAEKLIA
jgi:hypothetical protein